MTIDSLLKPFQRFGVHLGLERIERLLATLGNPHHRIPIIHVAGTNGKGSVCAYLSAVLTEAGYKVGRYISPHLIDWTERICINEKPISTTDLEDIIQQIQSAIAPNEESPTQFEVITSAAWFYFARSQVDIAIIEVGLGGRLDATNVCSNPLVSVITSISREHWQVLGSTLAEIAGEKAGILKPACPAVIGKLPDEAKAVVAARIAQLNCPAIWVEPAQTIKEGWANYQGIEYPLPLLGQIQLMNSAIAIASLQILQQQGWKIPIEAIQAGMAKTRWLGRLQWTTWNNSPLLVDGAHNPAAAQALRQYVDTLNKPITWVMGILSTKEHDEIFKALLRPGEHLYLVPVPDHSTANPEALATLAASICPKLTRVKTFSDLFAALDKAIQDYPERLTILCGSLYLVGYFLQHNPFVLKNSSEAKDK
ncbi:bifunctional folylpolyglutamate synthase/dihydrofolate synthase [Candidatus Gracilibacteria bacterium]|nr:bifunctional folylpolyglutamate synthase/dihydrofolate synthase [Candidatus Gracilibacteria bacterium]NJM89858.1 bifunctional folylpolyglutamate synthase/dihydrofolate synthase [Hydrococcus sp. RU_2_2]NJP22165.1 bifunctional folylpolyglutamate synthase/dihydrofolate synthase [Hydrococcus sp. CRU_1_1]